METRPTPAKRMSWSAVTSFERTRRRPLGRRTSMRQTPRRSSVGGRDDLHPRVGVVDPVHRDLADPQAEALGRDQQLGVEEPLVVLNEREQLRRRVAAQRLEAALGIAEAAAASVSLSNRLYAPRNQLALRAAHDVRARRQPGADGHVAVPGQQRGHQRQERGQGGREVHVHVRDDRSVARRPRRTQRVAAALAGQVHGGDAAHGRGQVVRHLVGAVRAGVVDHGDERRGRGTIRRGRCAGR